MRIDRLDLIAFGPFTGTSLDLSGGSEGIHLVYGPNEAGKSSALRAVQQFFRGIPSKSTDDFVHAYVDLRIGMSVRAADGSLLELIRRKGNKNTLLGGDAKPMADADRRLGRLLGGLGPESFLQKCVIDHAELVQGGHSILHGKGDLGQALFAAGSGYANLRAVGELLKEQSERLFKPRASNPSINAYISSLDLARKQVKEDSLRSSEWLAREESLRAATAKKTTAETRRDEAARQRNRLVRIQKAVAPIVQRARILDELKGLEGVPHLPSDFALRRRETLSLIPPNEKAEADARQSIAEIEDDLSRVVVPEDLLQADEDIEALYQKVSQYRQALTDRDALELERDRLNADARTLLGELGAKGDPESLRLTAAEQAAVTELALNRGVCSKERSEATAALEKHDIKRAATAQKLAALGVERSTGPLKKVLKAAQGLGDIEAELTDKREKVAQTAESILKGIAALKLWSGPVEALETLSLPPPEQIAHFEETLANAEAQVRDLQSKLQELESQSRNAEAQLEQLRLGGAVPDEESLGEARAARDKIWHEFRQVREWDDSRAVVFEAAGRYADDIADRLRREAGRVAERAHLVAEVFRLKSEQTPLQNRIAEALHSLRQERSGWTALWKPLGIEEPWTPRAMRGWAIRLEKLINDAKNLLEERKTLQSKETKLVAQRQALSAALNDAQNANESLTDLIPRAESLVEAIADETASRKRLAREIETLDLERPQIAEKAEAARAGWAEWESRWAQAMLPLGLSGDALTAEAQAVLTRSTTLFDRLDGVQRTQQQINELTRTIVRFETDVQALAGRIVPEPAREVRGRAVATDPATTAATLFTRLKEARKARAQRESLATRHAEAIQASKTASEEIARLRRDLAGLCREANCKDDNELPEIERKATLQQELIKTLATLEVRIDELSAGADRNAFLAEVLQYDADDLPGQIAQLDETLQELGSERDEAMDTIGRERQALLQMDGNARAADAGQYAESLRARIREEVEQYARLRLASAVLRTGIERYRDKARGPVVERASALFALLTVGSFEGLCIDYNDTDEPVLKGIRSGTRESVDVCAMSLGTADQLYLALRIASLEGDADRLEPLPLIVDDILVQFDDERSGATFEVLAKLSKRTQVIVFTHHAHLIDLARERVPKIDLFVHKLPGPRHAVAKVNGA